jgi:hypothetical protein
MHADIRSVRPPDVRHSDGSPTEAVTVTTQSPHLYERQARPAAYDSGAGRTPTAARAQTRLPWWAVALPVLAFAALLALLSGGPAQASAADSGGDLFGRTVAALGVLAHHLL